MRRKSLTVAWLTLSVFALSGASCPKVKIRDHEICGDKGAMGAKCFHTLSAQTRTLDLEQWDDERFGQLCMKADAYANLKAALLKLCDSSRRCSWEQVKAIQTLGQNVSDFKRQTTVNPTRIGMK